MSGEAGLKPASLFFTYHYNSSVIANIPMHYRADEPRAKQAAPAWDENEDGELVPQGVDLIDVADMPKRRNLFYSAAQSQMEQSFPQKYGGLRMELSDAGYEGAEHFSPAEQKSAILSNQVLSRRLRGTVHLFDDVTGDKLDEKRITLMSVPHLTDRGTFIHNGNEYTTVSQSRLEAGPYTRRRENGELETQFNVRPGTGRQFRVGFEPETAQYRLRLQSSNLHLYSLLKDLGVDDDHLEQLWGKPILEANRGKYDKRVFGKAFEKFVPAWKRPNYTTPDEQRKAITEALEAAQINERIAQRNLPVLWDRRKQASYRKPDPATFYPHLSPSQVKESLVCTFGSDFRAKAAAFEDDELRVLAAFVTRTTGVAIPLSLDPTSLEEAIISAVTSGPTGVNAVMLQAGMEGLAQTKLAAAFNPDHEPDDMIGIYNSIYGHVGPRLASMKQWPEHWLHPDDPMGWLQWYEQYHAGRRHEDDERQIRRWQNMRSLHGGMFKKNPTPRRGWTLRNWAIDPIKLLDDPEAKERMTQEMEAYHAKETEKQTGRI